MTGTIRIVPPTRPARHGPSGPQPSPIRPYPSEWAAAPRAPLSRRPAGRAGRIPVAASASSATSDSAQPDRAGPIPDEPVRSGSPAEEGSLVDGGSPSPPAIRSHRLSSASAASAQAACAAVSPRPTLTAPGRIGRPQNVQISDGGSLIRRTLHQRRGTQREGHTAALHARPQQATRVGRPCARQQWPDRQGGGGAGDGIRTRDILPGKCLPPAAECTQTVGVLSGHRTHAARLERLRQQGLAETDLARIHAPIGLDLGGHTPADIALGILAEIVAVRHRLAHAAPG